MKKYMYIALGIVIVAALAWILFIKKNNTSTPVSTSTSTSTETSNNNAKTNTANSLPIIHLTQGQKATTTSLVVGQKFTVTATIPTTGGYQLNPLQYDATILALTSYTQNTWEFTAIKSGTTGLSITASQGTQKATTDILFSSAISVK